MLLQVLKQGYATPEQANKHTKIMINEEIYIDGNKLDLGESRITLNHRSNMLGDITTINASSSLTIFLPKTVHNRKILDFPDQPSYSGRFLRKYNKARYLRNGVELFSGFAVLLTSAEKYEIVLSWGELFELTEFLSEKDKLNEYIDDGVALQWDNNSSVRNPNYFAMYMNGYGNSPFTRIHPSVHVSEILQKIQDKSGLIFNFPQKTQQYLSDKKILCNTRNDNKLSAEKNPMRFTGLSVGSETEQHSGVRFINSNLATITNDFGGFNDGNATLFNMRARRQMRGFVVNASIIAMFQTQNPNISFIEIQIFSRNGNFKAHRTIQFSPIFGNAMQLDRRTIIDVELDVGDRISITISLSAISFSTTTPGFIEITRNFQEDANTPSVPFPGLFPVYYNLPDISLADFVKNISVLTGTFPHRKTTDPKNVITFSPIEAIYQNKSIALDWSDKLIFRGYPKKVDYRLNKMAQQNFIRYKHDDDVPTRAYGIIEVDDKTIEREKDFFTMAFSATEARSNTAIIRQYETELNDSDPTNPITEILREIEVKPRLLSSRSAGNMNFLDFNGLSFSEIVPGKYAGYQRMAREPIVLEEDFKLNEFDLRDLDYTVPIYLRQYGRYYAIKKIQDMGNIATVELLQLN